MNSDRRTESTQGWYHRLLSEAAFWETFSQSGQSSFSPLMILLPASVLGFTMLSIFTIFGMIPLPF
jgi:hypothetical protein